MSTSPFQGQILFAVGDFDVDEPADTALVRDALCGSLLHLADEAAQVRVCWVATDATLSVANTTHADLTPADNGSVTVDEWFEFPLRGVYCPKVRADGSGYPLRIHFAGTSSAGHSVDFAVLVAPRLAEDRLLGGWGDPIWPRKYYSGVTSTTVGWRSSDDASLMLEVPADTIAAALDQERAWATYDDLGGTPTSVIVPTLEILVLGKTSNVASVPQLYGLVASEYIGT